MTLEEFVDTYGEFLNKRFIVLRKIEEGETSFKALKKYTITLYEHLPKKKPVEMFKTELTDRIIESTKNAVAEKAEKVFLKKLFEFYGSGSKSISDTDN